MKKIFAAIIAVLMIFSSIGAFANTDFLTDVYTNYTGDYSLKISFEGSDEIISLLNEMEMPDEVENYVNLKELLTSILSLDAKMQLQLDASEDMQTVKMALTADTNQSIDINKNLDVSVNAKTGMWITMDISDKENPLLEVVYSYPFLNKYMVIDAFEMAADEEKEQIVSSLSAVMNRELLIAVNTYCTEVLKKYADIRVSAGKCIISIDNEALTKMLDEVMPYITRQVADIMLNVSEDEDAVSDVLGMFEKISFDGLQLLGNKGVKYTYTLRNGKISGIDVDADICIDISKIYMALTGEEWGYISNGKIEFSLVSESKMSKIGTTKVELPDITEENSFKMSDMLPVYEDYEEYDNYEEYPEYPHWYAGDWAESIPVIDGEIFVPLRSTVESAYSDGAAISFNNGVIGVTSEYFPGFTKMTLTAGSDKVYTELGEYTTKTVFIENGVTYVSSKLFEELFGWELVNAQYNYVTDVYYYEFCTQE